MKCKKMYAQVVGYIHEHIHIHVYTIHISERDTADSEILACCSFFMRPSRQLLIDHSPADECGISDLHSLRNSILLFLSLHKDHSRVWSQRQSCLRQY